MPSQRGLLAQSQDSPFVKWIREEEELPPETWKRLYLVVVKRLERRDPYLTKVLNREAWAVEIYWGLLTKTHGQGSGARAGLETMFQEMEARTFPRGKAKQEPSVSYVQQFLLSEYVHADLERRPRDDRGQPEYVRSLINDVREKIGQNRFAVPVPDRLLDVVRHKSAKDAALSIVAYVCGGKPSYLKRKFVEVRKSLGRSTH